MRLWESVSQRKAIMDAGLEGLEECPFCDYSVIIENEEEKLFKCRNEGVCGVVSCRACKKPVATSYPLFFFVAYLSFLFLGPSPDPLRRYAAFMHLIAGLTGVVVI